MSKKTNKTNHVLNLLSGGGKEPEETKETKEKAPDEKKEEGVPHVPVVRGGGDSEAAEKIRLSLAEELKEELEKERAARLEQEAGQTKEDNAGRKPKPRSSEEGEADRKQAENAQEPPSGGKGDSKKAPAPAKEDRKDGGEEQDDFIIVNVMERLVKDRVEKYMEQFKTCSCRRCRADITALSLTELPAKYVVVNRNAVSPLMNFYMVKYAGMITVAVTKACMAVQADPHHKGEDQ